MFQELVFRNRFRGRTLASFRPVVSWKRFSGENFLAAALVPQSRGSERPAPRWEEERLGELSPVVAEFLYEEARFPTPSRRVLPILTTELALHVIRVHQLHSQICI